MDKKMELLRETINNMIVSDLHNEMDLLNKSQELDLLILQYIKESDFVQLTLGYEHMNEFDIIIDKLQLFKRIFQSMRIVDPVSKKALELNEGELGEMEVYKVTSIPISIQKKKIVLELFKDVAEHMNQAVTKDELTDLYNRGYINEKLHIELLSSSLKNEPLSIIFVDLDFFKMINDKYGHLIRAQVLQEFAEELKGHIRNTKSWAARYSDEEFMICLTNTDSEAARAIAEKIRKSVTEKEFNIRDQRIQLTCSLGVYTVCNDNKCLTIDDIIQLADKKIFEKRV